MTYKTVFNTSADALVVSSESRVIGGYEWGSVDSSDPAASALIDSGTLVVQERPEGEISEDAATAFDATDEFGNRSKVAAGLDKDSLFDAIEEDAPEVLENLPVGGDGMPSKADLVEVVSEHPEIDLPTSDSKGTRSSKKKEA